jgi:hypothetical protein
MTAQDVADRLNELHARHPEITPKLYRTKLGSTGVADDGLDWLIVNGDDEVTPISLINSFLRPEGRVVGAYFDDAANLVRFGVVDVKEVTFT